MKINNFRKTQSKIKPNTPTAPTCTIALAGNPNSGKTTLFNVLTGSNQKVGNWPGVTVEQKIGTCKKYGTARIVDTPGIYSLSPFATDEQITLHYLTDGQPDVIINVVDSTNLERNLFLTTQLLELNIPVVVALNMQDEADKMGIAIDANKLEAIFGCKFFPISAAKNQGVETVMNWCLSIARSQKKPARTQHTATHITSHTTASTATTVTAVTADKFAAAKIRYDKISAAVRVAQTVTPRYAAERSQTLTQKIDKFVLNKWLAFPIFAIVMTLVFFFSIDGLGGFLTDLITLHLTPFLQTTVSGWFAQVSADALQSLVVDGIIGGVMSVVGFLPQIMLLFGFIAILETCGYMSRIAFITDRLLCRLGLNGRSFVSMILGCGCSVPAIMATRTIKNVQERNATITLAPFVPCSAKLAVISFFTSYVFHGNALFAISFYFLSIAAIILGGLVLKLISKRNAAPDAFIMELPPYRAPTATNVAKQMWERGKSFLKKAGTVIFVASVLLWLLTNFNTRFEMTDAENSMLAALGKLLAPLFYPLGWNDAGCGWQFAIATLSGLAAKETVVTTLEILLPHGVGGSISVLGAYSFVAYNLLTVPCIAAVSASFAEQGAQGVRSVIFQICTAYTVSLVIYQVGKLAQMHISAFVITICCAAICVAMLLAIKYILKRRKCGHCSGCHGHCGCKME